MSMHKSIHTSIHMSMHMSMHMSVHMPTHTLRYPMPKLELYALIISFQGLLLSSTQMMSLSLAKNTKSGNADSVCTLAGTVIFLLPTSFLAFVMLYLWWYVTHVCAHVHMHVIHWLVR